MTNHRKLGKNNSSDVHIAIKIGQMTIKLSNKDIYNIMDTSWYSSVSSTTQSTNQPSEPLSPEISSKNDLPEVTGSVVLGPTAQLQNSADYENDSVDEISEDEISDDEAVKPNKLHRLLLGDLDWYNSDDDSDYCPSDNDWSDSECSIDSDESEVDPEEVQDLIIEADQLCPPARITNLDLFLNNYDSDEDKDYEITELDLDQLELDDEYELRLEILGSDCEWTDDSEDDSKDDSDNYSDDDSDDDSDNDSDDDSDDDLGCDELVFGENYDSEEDPDYEITESDIEQLEDDDNDNALLEEVNIPEEEFVGLLKDAGIISFGDEDDVASLLVSLDTIKLGRVASLSCTYCQQKTTHMIVANEMTVNYRCDMCGSEKTICPLDVWENLNDNMFRIVRAMAKYK